MPRWGLVLLWLAGRASCCVLLASCTKGKPAGELVVVVTTDLSVPKDIDALHANVSLASGQTLLNQDSPLGPAGLRLPATLGVVAGPDTKAPVTIQVSGVRNGATRLTRQAVVTVPTDRVATLSMPLDWLCIGVSCRAGETCQAGACASATAVPDDLPVSGTEGGTADAGDACFDTTACFESAVLWPMPLGPDCAVPWSRWGARLNVALVIAGGDGICGAGSCLVPLDAEGPEGWQASADGTRIELPLAACSNGAVRAVEVSTACLKKRTTSVTCPGATVPNAGGGCLADPDGGCPDGYVCESEGGPGLCVPSGGTSTTAQGPRCNPDSTVVCPGGAAGYACQGAPDPWLQCNAVRHRNCTTFGWCCVPATDSGACAPDAGQDAGPEGLLIDDMSMTLLCGGQNKLRIPSGVGTPGYWFTADDGTGAGSMVPTPQDGFNYMPVAAACEGRLVMPFSNAACMKSVAPYTSAFPDGWATMGFNFMTSGTNPDGGASTPIAFDVSGFRGIRFWAMASPSGSQTLSVQFSDVENDMAAPGAGCVQASPLQCYNFYQYTLALQSTWSPYEVDFDRLTQQFTNAQGFYTTQGFDRNAALGITFVASSDGGTPLTFDVCVAQIYFVPK